MTTEVYWNLHKGGYSVREHGRVVAHTDSIVLRNARFVVQLGGRARVLRVRQKSVHAMVRGDVIAADIPAKPRALRRVHYNPYRADHFHTEEGARVDAAPLVWFSIDANGRPVVEIPA